jgi:UbiD family decarboxylase
MSFESGLRPFMKILEDAGELKQVHAEVDWKYEVGAIIHEINRQRGPAILFKNVKDHHIPLLVGALTTTRRIALGLGIPPETPPLQIIQEYKERLKKPLEPRIVSSGPCKEVVYNTNSIDLYIFPAPLWHEMDGGRYIGTLHSVVCKDPETNWQNASISRMMIHDKQTCGILSGTGQHTAIIYSKFEEMRKPMPIAIAIGLDPVCILVSAAGFPAYVNEWAMAGALKKAPLELVKCETNDLYVPADAEIVIEGEVPIGERREEGQFGEHTGYFGGSRVPRPVVNVKCITHRENPIFQGTYEGMPPNEDHMITYVNHSALAWKTFEEMGFVGLKGIYFPPGADPWLSAIISIEKKYEGHGIDASRILFASKVGAFVKHIIVVDDDIDIYDLENVLWAINTRFLARRAIITQFEHGSMLDPSKPLEWGMVTERMVIDATWPMTHEFPSRAEWGGLRHPPTLKPSQGLLDRVRNRWREYGFLEDSCR